MGPPLRRGRAAEPRGPARASKVRAGRVAEGVGVRVSPSAGAKTLLARPFGRPPGGKPMPFSSPPREPRSPGPVDRVGRRRAPCVGRPSPAAVLKATSCCRGRGTGARPEAAPQERGATRAARGAGPLAATRIGAKRGPAILITPGRMIIEPLRGRVWGATPAAPITLLGATPAVAGALARAVGAPRVAFRAEYAYPPLCPYSYDLWCCQ